MIGSHCHFFQILGNNDEKIWLFQVGEDFAPWDVIDPNTGRFVGLHKEIMEGVCEIAKKKCEVVVYPYDTCVKTHSETGLNTMTEGLSGRWFDGCMGWSISRQRQLFAKFTLPIKEGGSKGELFTTKGNKLSVAGRGGNLTGITVAIWDSFIIDGQCLRQHGWTDFDHVVVNTMKEGLAVVKNGTADAFLTIQPSVDGEPDGKDFEVLDGFKPPIVCAAGMGIIVRKDSKLPQWWDEAYLKYKELPNAIFG